MLRNATLATSITHISNILNEVLSLNAQEFVLHLLKVAKHTILNEVLSLNAQEFTPFCVISCPYSFLNEVLSLNAQESLVLRLVVSRHRSSMKS